MRATLAPLLPGGASQLINLINKQTSDGNILNNLTDMLSASDYRRKEFPMKHFISKELAMAFVICGLAIVSTPTFSLAQTTEEGIANFYSDKFQGKKTASGEVYDKNGLTAAHKKHSYGTKLRVTNLENSKSVVVTVNDRMRKSNPVVVDVTHRAAQDLGFTKSGKTRVKVDVVE